MALQLQTAYTSYARQKRDITDVSSATFVEWCDWINKMVYRYLLGIDPERFITSQTYTVSSSPSTQALPATFESFTQSGCGFYLVDGSGNDTENTLSITGFGSQETGYYFNGGNVVFTGIQNATYKMRFAPTVASLTGLTSYFTLDGLTGGKVIIPESYLDFVNKAIDVMYTVWDEDTGMEGVSDQRFVRLLNEFANNIKRTPSVYGLSDFTTNF